MADKVQQRVTAELRGERLAEITLEPEAVGRRAWLVRESNVDGVDSGAGVVGGRLNYAATIGKDTRHE